MRHGTDWGRVEENLLKFRSLDYVVSNPTQFLVIMNYMTITEFYDYMHSKGLVDYEHDWWHSLYLCDNPRYYSAKALIKKMKEYAHKKLEKGLRQWLC